MALERRIGILQYIGIYNVPLEIHFQRRKKEEKKKKNE